MTDKVYILTFFLLLGISGCSVAQGTAHATMRVSVEVISGVNVETIQPKSVALTEEKTTNLGMLILRSETSGNILTSYSDKVKLENSSGDKLMLNINSKRQSRGENFDSFQFEGESISLQSEAVNSIYRGKLMATVEYL